MIKNMFTKTSSISFHSEDTSATAKTFKEKLSEKANVLEVDIKDHIEKIKQRMNENVSCRKFSISLYKVKSGVCFALGGNIPQHYSTYIPYGIEDWVYVGAFRIALENLGFDNIETKLTSDNSTYDCYTLKVEW